MKQLKNILCVLTPSDTCKTALERAVSLAENNQARLTVVDVVERVTMGIGMPDGGPISSDLQAMVNSDHLRTLEAFTAAYRQRVEISHNVLTGTGFIEIIRTVLRNEHDLVIKPAENPSFVERIFGSDDIQLLRQCPCPVWLMQPMEKSNYECIMAAVDFDPLEPETVGRGLNMEILELSSSLALSDFATLNFVHVWDVPEAGFVELWSDNPEAVTAKLFQGAKTHHQNGMQMLRRILHDHISQKAYEYISPHFHVLQGSAKTVIPEMATQLKADLVVMGTVARTGIAGLLVGNTADTILEQLRCSVLALKPPGFVTPIKL